MKRIVSVLTLTLVGGAFAQESVEVRATSVTKKTAQANTETDAVDSKMKAKVDALVVKLSDDDREVRKQAKADLIGMGIIARPLLAPYKKSDDPEIKVTVKEILKKIAFNHALNRDQAEPSASRKRALLKGAKAETTGERKWLDARNALGWVELTDEEDLLEDAQNAAAAAEAKRAAVAEALEKASAEIKAKAEAVKKAAEKKAKAEAAKSEAK